MTAKTHYQLYLITKHIWLVCRRPVFPLEFHAMEAANYNGCQRIDCHVKIKCSNALSDHFDLQVEAVLNHTREGNAHIKG